VVGVRAESPADVLIGSEAEGRANEPVHQLLPVTVPSQQRMCLPHGDEQRHGYAGPAYPSREPRGWPRVHGSVEASVRQARLRGPGPHATIALVAAARYLAAHSPTVRAQGQTFQIASRLLRGEHLHEDAEAEAEATPVAG
jgi:hypothetical protein